MELIWVIAARDDGRVALWERDAEHPGVEVFLAAGDAGIQVARTPLVNLKLHLGELAIVEAPRDVAATPPAALRDDAAAPVSNDAALEPIAPQIAAEEPLEAAAVEPDVAVAPKAAPKAAKGRA